MAYGEPSSSKTTRCIGKAVSLSPWWGLGAFMGGAALTVWTVLAYPDMPAGERAGLIAGGAAAGGCLGYGAAKVSHCAQTVWCKKQESPIPSYYYNPLAGGPPAPGAGSIN